MKQKFLLFILILFSTLFIQERVPFLIAHEAVAPREAVLATREMSLANRYANEWVNDVFKDNILLTISYASGQVRQASDINWDAVKQSQRYEVVLQPGEVFAYHDDVLPEFRDKTIVTTNARFGAGQGFRSSGSLYGDGVCHFASLIHWAAQDAGLKVTSLVNHDFANIPEVPREYGTSIITTGTPSLNAQRQNLYVENTFEYPVKIVFDYAQDTDILQVSVTK